VAARAKAGETVLSVDQDNIDSEKGVEQSQQNWTGVLKSIKKIVESRGGQVTLESAPGSGATFRFTWPERPTEEG